MTSTGTDDMKEAWRDATDADVVQALRNPEDYASIVAGIVRDEAARRGLCADSPYRSESTPQQHFVVYARGVCAFVCRHKTSVAVVLGALFPVGRMLRTRFQIAVATELELAVLSVFLLLSLGFLCWPLTDYRMVNRLCLRAACGFALAGVLGAFARNLVPSALPYIAVPIAGIAVVVLVWAIGSGTLCAAVYLRRRFFPSYPRGHCTKCGYNLFGLVSHRCPECGRPFSV